MDNLGIPISDDQARAVREQVQRDQQQSEREQSTDKRRSETEQRQRSTEQRTRQQQAPEDEQKTQQAQGEQPEPDPAPGGDPEPSLLAQLLALLRQLLPYLLGAVLAALAGYLIYRRRHRLLALVGLFGGPADRAGDDATEPGFEFEPENEVDAAWLALMAAVSDDPRRDRTPADVADEAVDAGYDASAVHELTRVFEEVTYGGLAVTDERRRRAIEALDSLGLSEGPVGPTATDGGDEAPETHEDASQSQREADDR